jgi:hypothetical protein
MATPQLSPGILVREVDLTVGRADNVLDNIGAIAGPFRLGPIDTPIQVSNEEELIKNFGKPLSTDRQYEYWMSAASFLSYGGVLKVVRADSANLGNANAGVGIASTTVKAGTGGLKIESFDDYQENHESDTSFYYAAKHPGSWGNGLKVCQIDDVADQIIGINTTSLEDYGCTIGTGVTAAVTNLVLAGVGTTTVFTGHLKGIVTGVRTDATNGDSKFDVKITSRVSSAGTEFPISYATNSLSNSFKTVAEGLNQPVGAAATTIFFVNSSGINTGAPNAANTAASAEIVTAVDWYDQQTLGLQNSTIFWKSLAPRPTTNKYASDRGGKNDGIHVVVVDDAGVITGIQGNVIERFTGLSKAVDAISNVNSPEKIYYKQRIAERAENIYAGFNPSQSQDAFHKTTDGAFQEPRATGFGTGFVANTTAQGLWSQNAQGTTFAGIGNVSYTLGGGTDYTSVADAVPAAGENGGMKAELGDLKTAYDTLSNKDEQAVDFLIMGPGCSNRFESQSKANHLISIVEARKDCMATIGPHRGDIVNISNSLTQTNNLIEYFSPLTSSSFATFDSGYKYMFDRFNNEFRFVPTNGDTAGLMVRTAITSFPWFSPAGEQRGVINNAIKLAYNPTKDQRDLLYPQRINSFITKAGVGTLLFGDKTALSFASAFDRINVRRLFLTVEQALESAAEAQLFELNDELTRANFRNIVEPFLRDVEAKRGLSGFLVICDTSNNTPDVIDNNEFRADIFLKPSRSINYITLTFVATRTGVSFEEVAGRV